MSPSFLLEMLLDAFGLRPDEAMDVVEGSAGGGEAVFGRYSYEVAETRLIAAVGLASASGQPVELELRQVDDVRSGEREPRPGPHGPAC